MKVTEKNMSFAFCLLETHRASLECRLLPPRELGRAKWTICASQVLTGGFPFETGCSVNVLFFNDF